MSDMKSYRLSARVDEDTRKKLEHRARLEAKDESTVVREALNSYLSQKPESAYTVFERAGGIGIVKGLSRDVSTNRKYFEGFSLRDDSRSTRHRTARRSSRS